MSSYYVDAQTHYKAARRELTDPTPEQRLQLAVVAAVLALGETVDDVAAQVAYLSEVTEGKKS